MGLSLFAFDVSEAVWIWPETFENEKIDMTIKNKCALNLIKK